jgi:hypothetical protein
MYLFYDNDNDNDNDNNNNNIICKYCNILYCSLCIYSNNTINNS